MKLMDILLPKRFCSCVKLKTVNKQIKNFPLFYSSRPPPPEEPYIYDFATSGY